ncbi:MAG: FAD-binding oxidoreductase [Gemmatimonadetes bacterium]|nr:FAD-binding oxidoreductase [Gemmatimonadota bacterium]
MSVTLATDADVRAAYSRDASGLERLPEAVARPTDAAEVAAIVAEAAGASRPVTAAGAQTSTTGASITDRGVLLSLRGLDRIVDLDVARRLVRAQAGVRLGDLKRACAAEGLLLPADPTSEEDCTVGGAIACNASGARSLRHGPIRPHVAALDVVLADGRAEQFRRMRIEKNTVGYAAVQDPVDWFVGSEGTLGVVTEATFALEPLPERVTGIALPFARETDALAFVVAARRHRTLDPRCLEYCDAQATAIVAHATHDTDWLAARALVYVEDAGDGDAPLDDWLALAESHAAIEPAIRVYETEAAFRDARKWRHAVPATMHERAAPFRASGGRRVSTDWAVPYPALGRVLGQARALADEAGIAPAVTFGHAGNGHPHQNWVGEHPEHVARIERVVEATLRLVIAEGGTVAAEHGVGKLKARWLPLQLGARQLGLLRAIKRELDPQGILAPGNLVA